MNQDYLQHRRKEIKAWKRKMNRPPSLSNKLAKSIQVRLNAFIPGKVHAVITSVIKQMVRGVLFGATYTSAVKQPYSSLSDIDLAVQQRIGFYKTTAAVEGGITGAGGILMGLADFPALLAIKMKLLFDIAGMYGFDVKEYKERLFILYIFQLAFSSQQHRQKVFQEIEDWQQNVQQLPQDIHQFDWHNFQQEYRDHIDLAKMAQLIPGIGAVVGYVVNKAMIARLGTTAMNAYGMRLLA